MTNTRTNCPPTDAPDPVDIDNQTGNTRADRFDALVVNVCSTTAVTYERDGGGNVFAVVHRPYTRVESRQTARNDAQFTVEPGRYPLAPVTIGRTPTTYENAYYFVGDVSGLLRFGGFPDETVGETTIESRFSPYGYEVRSLIAAEAADTFTACGSAWRIAESDHADCLKCLAEAEAAAIMAAATGSNGARQERRRVGVDLVENRRQGHGARVERVG